MEIEIKLKNIFCLSCCDLQQKICEESKIRKVSAEELELICVNFFFNLENKLKTFA